MSISFLAIMNVRAYYSWVRKTSNKLREKRELDSNPTQVKTKTGSMPLAEKYDVLGRYSPSGEVAPAGYAQILYLVLR